MKNKENEKHKFIIMNLNMILNKSKLLTMTMTIKAEMRNNITNNIQSTYNSSAAAICIISPTFV